MRKISSEVCEVRYYMYGYVYETLCKVNGKKYIGQHKGPFNEGYIGSGIALVRAVQKYGAENFSVTLIVEANSREELNILEKQYIEKANAVNSSNYYNIAKGGEGGDTISGSSYKPQGCPHSESWKANISKGNKGKRLGIVESEEIRRKKSSSHTGLIRVTKGSVGKWIKPEELESFLCEGYRQGGVSVNSGDANYLHNSIGIYCWVNNGITDTRIRRSELPQYIAKGYKQGRVFKPRKNVQRLSKV